MINARKIKKNLRSASYLKLLKHKKSFFRLFEKWSCSVIKYHGRTFTSFAGTFDSSANKVFVWLEVRQVYRLFGQWRLHYLQG